MQCVSKKIIAAKFRDWLYKACSKLRHSGRAIYVGKFNGIKCWKSDLKFWRYHTVRCFVNLLYQIAVAFSTDQIFGWNKVVKVTRKHFLKLIPRKSRLRNVKDICHRESVRSFCVDIEQDKSERFDSCDRPSNSNWIQSSIFQPVCPWNLMFDLKKL